MSAGTRWALGALVLLSIALVAHSSWVSAHFSSTDFLSIKLVDILRLIWTAALALWLGSAIRERDSSRAKTRELVDSAVRDYEGKLLILVDAAERHAQSTDNSFVLEIQAASKRARQSLGALVELLKSCRDQVPVGRTSERLQAEYTQLNGSITDKFLTSKAAERSALLAIAEGKHEQVKSSLVQLKFSIYNGRGK
jgi:hypothetical protein